MQTLDRVSGLRDLWQVTRDSVYINHASMGPLPRPVIDAVTGLLEEHARFGGTAYPRWMDQVVEGTRTKMAAFINATPDEVALTKNTPEGISTVAAGLAWEPGDNVVTASIEFPANVFPWLNLRARGVEVRFVAPREGRIDIDDLFSRVDRRTRVVALSHVEFSTGFRNDTGEIGRRCRDLGVYLLVDAIQSLGVLPVDVAAQRIDFLAAASHKWLCAPMGVGWFFCRRELQERLALTDLGQASVTPRPRYTDYTFTPQPSARRFESGILNIPGIAGLAASLDLLGAVGIDRISARVLALTDRLATGLEQRGYRVSSSRRQDDRSGIVAFTHERHSPETVLARLEADSVVVSVREGSVRASPHFYDDEGDIDRLLNALP